MAVTYEQLMRLQARDVAYAYSERDTLLYAMAIGMGRDPFDERELDYVYERRGRLRAVPSQAITVARHNLIYDVGLAVEKMLHGEQTLTLHRSLPVAAELRADHRIVQVYDKGPGKGSIIETESRVRLADGAPLFDIHNLYVARGDGGIGGPPLEQPRARPMPQRMPDLVVESQTLPFQALLYRLTGDRNVIHADPAIARAMGFAGPILHGSCTLGIACRAVLAAVCDYDAARLTRLGTRFTAVVYPGEAIMTDIWVEGSDVRFRCRAPKRGAVVLDHGQCVVAAR
ncbi:MAG: MaoC family dehydratase N-terminal domain-containing protein [Burkholderiales bacterium]|nr:MaoC family dehydratase N-terminal domain-containing protein [Burkholderiales bacterium]